MDATLRAYRRFSESVMAQESLKRRWVQLAIVLGVLIFSASSAVALPGKYHIFVIGLPFALVGLFVLLKWPPLGLVGLTILGLFRAIHIPLIGLPAVMLSGLTVLWIFKMLAYDKIFKLVITPSVTAVLFFIIAVLISSAVGQFPWFPVSGAPVETQIGGALIFLASFFAFLLVAQQVRDIRWLKWMVFPFLAFAGLFAILAVVPGGRRIIHQIFSTKATGGSLFWVWSVSLSISQALFNRKLKMSWRILLGFVGIGILYVGIIPGRSWVSGWVPPIIALVTIVWVGMPNIALPLSTLAAAIMASQYSTLYNLVAGENEYSAVSRLDAWRVMGEIIGVNPILGVGPSNYYFYTPLFNILGFYVQFNSHNNYIDLLAQTGVVGFLCFFWFVWTIGKLGFRLLKRVPKGGFAHAYVVACIGGLVASVVAGMLGDWVLPFYYNIGIEGLRASAPAWMYWGGLVAIEQMLLMNKPVD